MRQRRWTFLLIAAVVAYVAVVAIWVARDRRSRSNTGGAFSTFNTSPAGCSVALAYLQRSGAARGASALTRAIDATEVPQNGVVFRIAPAVSAIEALLERQQEKKSDTSTIPPLLSNNEEQWVAAGGRLVIALQNGTAAVPLIEQQSNTVRKVFPMWSGLETLAPPVTRAFGTVRDTHSLFTIGDAPLVLRKRHGRGDVILIAAPELFQNKQIGDQRNLMLLTVLAGGRPAFFDEVAHGIRTDAGMVELMKRWGFGPFLLLLVLSFAVRLWRNGTRLGPPDPESVDSRSEAIDMVESIGALYRKALQRGELLQMYRKAFVGAVAHHTSLRGDELQRRVRQLVEEDEHEHEPSKSAFLRQLARLNEGFGRLERGKRR